MEIDFHHSTVYVLGRMAGLTPDQAYIAAYSSQYVDDAGTYFASQMLKVFEWHAVFFEDYSIFEYIDSSHEILDVGMWKELDQHKVWIPFHFLPGGNGSGFSRQAVCAKAWDGKDIWVNQIAKDMVDEVVNNAGKHPWGLHRLGVTLHVLADTYAHQNFAGIKNADVNDVSKIKVESPGGYPPLSGAIKHLPALGHARAEHLPDLPFVVWNYINSDNKEVTRDNPADFALAADIILNVLDMYRQKWFPQQQPPSVEDRNHDMKLVKDLFKYSGPKDPVNSIDGKIRDAAWIGRIKTGTFKCCPLDDNEKTAYYAEGEKHSWWAEVTEMCPWSSDPRWYVLGYRKYDSRFGNSNYRLFQTALKTHFDFVANILLPKHDIPAL